MTKIGHRLHDLADRSTRFGKELTAGLSRAEVARLFDQDARGAYQVLAEKEPETSEASDEFTRALLRIKGFFVGFALKLSPARRLLFLLCLACTALGLVDLGPRRLLSDLVPWWFLTSIAGLTLLLALELVDRLRVRDELEVARQLQGDLLPQRAPEIPGYRLTHSYRTANEIGGDYYDFLPLPDGRIALAVGDASGHGISAGLVMAIANATFKTALDVDPDPQAVLAQLNRVLARTGTQRAFMTLFVGLLDPATGELDYANAGHPFPLVRRAGGSIEELGEGSLPLGLNRQGSFPAGRTTLGPEDLLVLYSDGIPEAEGATTGNTFGFDRLKALLAGDGSPQTVHDRILLAVERHLGDHALNDDLTLVVLDRAPVLQWPTETVPLD